MENQTTKICFIEDDPIIGEALSLRFELDGHSYEWFQSGKQAYESLKNKHYSIVISDIRLPDITGEEIFLSLLADGINLPPFVFITGYGTIDQAVHLLKLGAQDYLVKPFKTDELIQKIQQLSHFQELRIDEFEPLGISQAMQNVESLLRRLVDKPVEVLITGESGVGKEYVARKLHYLENKEKPFVAVNCGALTESLLETELFGHEKGAFTGAVSAKRGVFEQAKNGTLFLDEIGDMPISMQIKVLRAIQEKSIVRVGAEKTIVIDVRLINATHQDLKEMIKRGEFRNDLYYRINTIEIKIPPLRERKMDIIWFAQRFLKEISERGGKQKFVLSPSARHALIEYPWPGNIRELKHVIERGCILANSGILTPDTLFGEAQMEFTREHVDKQDSLSDYLDECERLYIERAITSNDWMIQKTADFLGCSRKTLWEKMRKHNIKHSDG